MPDKPSWYFKEIVRLLSVRGTFANKITVIDPRVDHVLNALNLDP